jgi:hypothetical protein
VYSTTTLSEYFAADHTNLSTSFGPFSSVKTYCLAVSGAINSGVETDSITGLFSTSSALHDTNSTLMNAIKIL